MERYAAKLLFDWYPDPITGGRVISGHRLWFVGVLQLMRLGAECADGEVWWELRRRRRAKERPRALLPAARTLWVFGNRPSRNVGQRVSGARLTSRLSGPA
jgi:hypothetical protein